MILRAAREFDLAIDPDTVRLFAEKARAISADVSDGYSAGHDHEIELEDEARDAYRDDGLAEEEEEDLTAEELRELIADLNVDETADLVALAFVGRGDFSADEWADAQAAARQRGNIRIAAYLMGMPMLGEWLEAGLEAIGA